MSVQEIPISLSGINFVNLALDIGFLRETIPLVYKLFMKKVTVGSAYIISCQLQKKLSFIKSSVSCVAHFTDLNGVL